MAKKHETLEEMIQKRLGKSLYQPSRAFVDFGKSENFLSIVIDFYTEQLHKKREKMTDFEEEYMDVLQNIEFAIVNVYRENKELTDYDVDKVINALIRTYQAENKQKSVNKPKLSEQAEEVYVRVHGMCDWRLGRGHVTAENEEDEKLFMQDPKTVEEIISCLKRIRKSIKRWSKVGGRQGYLQYIDQFIE